MKATFLFTEKDPYHGAERILFGWFNKSWCVPAIDGTFLPHPSGKWCILAAAQHCHSRVWLKPSWQRKPVTRLPQIPAILLEIGHFWWIALLYPVPSWVATPTSACIKDISSCRRVDLTTPSKGGCPGTFPIITFNTPDSHPCSHQRDALAPPQYVANLVYASISALRWHRSCNV